MDGYELGGCRLIRRIGSGAMGEVYLAEQVRLGYREVAVKLVPVTPDVSWQPDASTDSDHHIIREAQLLGRLTHPHILPVYHSGIESGYRFLVMQYAPHGSLADAIKGRGRHPLKLPLSLAFVVDIIGQVADALQYTHEQGIIHADVKPGNVLVQIEPSGRWHVLLADFGISHSADTPTTQNEVAGSPAYMAPEQFAGQMSPASDQYALGVMAFQLLAGHIPFVGDLPQLVYAHQHARPPALGALNPTVSSAVEAAIMRALAKWPADRYPSMAAFAEALRAASLETPESAEEYDDPRDFAQALHEAALETGMADATIMDLGATGPPWDEAGLSSAATRTATVTRIFNAALCGAARQAELPSPAAIRVPERPATAGRGERRPLSMAWASTVSVTGHGAAGQPATPRRRASGRRSVVAGLAAIALLLVAGVAAIGSRSHIAFTLSSSTPGAAGGIGQTPGAGGAPGGTSTPSSPNRGSWDGRRLDGASGGNNAFGGQGGTSTQVPTAPPATAPIATPALLPQPTVTPTFQLNPTATSQPTQPSVPLGHKHRNRCRRHDWSQQLQPPHINLIYAPCRVPTPREGRRGCLNATASNSATAPTDPTLSNPT